MADEEDPWAFDDAGDTQETVVAAEAATDLAPAAVVTRAESAAASLTGSIAADDILVIESRADPLPHPPVEDDGYRKPVQLYKHWVRPKFLQYKYMYNYRTNYYDDVIDYLDKKQVGVTREIPRPQTWAERVLRTNNASGRDVDSYNSSHKRDNHLIQTLAAKIRTHNYHTKAYINQKYASVL